MKILSARIAVVVAAVASIGVGAWLAGVAGSDVAAWVVLALSLALVGVVAVHQVGAAARRARKTREV